MNDGQASLMAEMKKMQEMMMSTLSLSGRSDNYGMMKEFFALQAEVKQMKEDHEELKEELEDQKDEYEEDQLKMQKELEEQKVKYDEELANQQKMQLEMQKELRDWKNAYTEVFEKLEATEKTCKELAEQQTVQLAVNEKTKELELKIKQSDESLRLKISRIQNEESGNEQLFCAMLSEINELKEQQKRQKQVLEAQKVEYKKVCDELAALKTELSRNVRIWKKKCEDLEKQKDEMEKIKVDQKAQKEALNYQLAEHKKVCNDLKKQMEELEKLKVDLWKQNGEYEKVCEDLEKQKDEMKKLKVDQEAQKWALAARKIEYEKVCKEVVALITKQREEDTAVREKTPERKKKQKARDLKLQNHDDSISNNTFMPVEYEIVGKWRIVSSTGRVEYEKHRLADDYYKGDWAKIDFENREFTYVGTLKSYVDNNTEDPSFKIYYSDNDARQLVYCHKAIYTPSYKYIKAYLEKEQLVIVATIYKDSGAAATCHCYYDRV